MEDVIAALLVPLVLCAKLRVFIPALFGPSGCSQACEYLSRSNSQNRLRAFALSGANRTSMSYFDARERCMFLRDFLRVPGARPIAQASPARIGTGPLGPALDPSACSARLSHHNDTDSARRRVRSFKHVRPAETALTDTRGSLLAAKQREASLTDRQPSTRPLHDKQSRTQAAA